MPHTPDDLMNIDGTPASRLAAAIVDTADRLIPEIDGAMLASWAGGRFRFPLAAELAPKATGPSWFLLAAVRRTYVEGWEVELQKDKDGGGWSLLFTPR